jgi:hypothetical protein
MVSEVGYKPTPSNRKGGNDDTKWLSVAALNGVWQAFAIYMNTARDDQLRSPAQRLI